MANDKKNTNELVTDDDPTAELEVLTVKQVTPIREEQNLSESAADTYDHIHANGADLAVEIDELKSDLKQRSDTINQLQYDNEQLRAQLERVESYADSLRQLLHDRTIVRDQAEDTREFLESSLKRVSELAEELRAELAEEKTVTDELGRKLDRQSDAHAEEIRILRFELGESQETITQHELLTGQLASDLADTRGFRNELEHTLSESEEQNNARIERLKKENHRLLQEAGEHEENLATKSEAINCLLAELAKKSQQIDSIGEIEDVIHEIDDRMSERIDERKKQERDRVTRVLIGSVGGRDLRFPLFKDRLTIGRTEQNDIQLKASYVSRRHAAIVTEHEATRVIDWGSKNGVFVNSERITEHFLRNGDTVTIGTADFRYEERPKRNA
jgi:hypothetical protein